MTEFLKRFLEDHVASLLLAALCVMICEVCKYIVVKHCHKLGFADGVAMGNFSLHWKAGPCQQYGACNMKGKVEFKRTCLGKNNVTLGDQYCKGVNTYQGDCYLSSCLGKWNNTF